MDIFFSGIELSFLLLTVLIVYILVWHLPLQGSLIMMVYFILLLVYTVIKFLLSPQFRHFPLVKSLITILFIPVISEYLIIYDYHTIHFSFFRAIIDYLSNLSMYLIFMNK
ncbi:hypothetical protein [Priestia megaterium]|jgi:hypothetical protein|uniref:hypothetical protein n=1 Tax=Priestia megaterium TaxID=1404 RepID=UPI001A94A5CA|nr:hypothetical protein [Priestia megaterium]MDF2014238.1 hypothetical protein [Priestia megaterium]QSX23642.1 hypothetical protein J0P05_28075 [Priestia megaterium]